VHDQAKDVDRGRVEPLGVVDRDQRRCLGRRRAESRERAARDGDAIRKAFSRRSQQGELERLTLRLGKGVEHGIGHALEEVAETEKRKRAPGLRRSTEEDSIRATLRGVDDRAPDGRLADSRLALEDERSGRPVRDAVEEPVCFRHLPLPSDQLHCFRPSSAVVLLECRAEAEG
jgi:hypothetical protein